MQTLISRACARLLDGADLLLDFLTLGEYGLEPAAHEAALRPAAADSACRSRLAA
jgi:hypothetical protein